MRVNDGSVRWEGAPVREIDRRVVTAGAAWSVPAILIATASPAAAASPVVPPPTVSFTSASGVLDPTTDSITFALEATSSGDGQIYVNLLDGAAATGLPVVQAIGAGANTVGFTVSRPGLQAGPALLTYTVDGGDTQKSLPVDVASPTRYTSGSARPAGVLDLVNVDFTLQFTGSAASTVEIKGITSTAGAWSGYPTGPQVLAVAAGGGLQLTFDARRPALAAAATVSLSIDGGPPLEVGILVAPL
jgi:hypothetical protein